MAVPIDYEPLKRSSSRRTWLEILCLLSFPAVSLVIAIVLVVPPRYLPLRPPLLMLVVLLPFGPIAVMARGVPLLITIRSRLTWELILFRVLLALALLAWTTILWLMLTD